jgi:hypothetical protein
MTGQHNKPNSNLSLFFWLPYMVLFIFAFIYLSYNDSTIAISPYLFFILVAIIIFARLAGNLVNDSRIKEIFNISPILAISLTFIYYISIVENNTFVLASLIIILGSVVGLYHEKKDFEQYVKNSHVSILFSYFLLFAFVIMMLVSFKSISGDVVFLLACTLGFTVFTPLLYLFYCIGDYTRLYVYTGFIDINLLILIILKLKAWYT